MAYLIEGDLDLYLMALGYDGVNEIQHEDFIDGIADDLNLDWLADKPGVYNWCAAFVHQVLKDCGKKRFKGVKAVRALEYAHIGEHVDVMELVGNPQKHLGTVCVFRRRNRHGQIVGGHVGFFAGFAKKWVNGELIADTRYIRILGGNQADRVKHSFYKMAHLVAAVSPVEEDSLDTSNDEVIEAADKKMVAKDMMKDAADRDIDNYKATCDGDSND